MWRIFRPRFDRRDLADDEDQAGDAAPPDTAESAGDAAQPGDVPPVNRQA